MSYKIGEFITQCNLTPILKKYREKFGGITRANLKEVNFIKDTYNLVDLNTLNRIFCDFRPPEESEILTKVYKAKRNAKDLRHLWLIKSLHNQKFIIQIRKELGMLFENRGFSIKEKVLKAKSKSGLGLLESYTNTNFSFSPEFEEWFFRNSKNKSDFDEWEGASASNHEIILTAINKILLKWKLPRRYETAIRELVLFNRIIPASSGIQWSTRRDSVTGELQNGIFYDADTTKKELIDTIKEDQYGIFKNKKKFLKGESFRMKRKGAKMETIIYDYNLLKKGGKQDKSIFIELAQKYQLSKSGIRKCIKGS
jgi:hypothetical protein